MQVTAKDHPHYAEVGTIIGNAAAGETAVLVQFINTTTEVKKGILPDKATSIVQISWEDLKVINKAADERTVFFSVTNFLSYCVSIPAPVTAALAVASTATMPLIDVLSDIWVSYDLMTSNDSRENKFGAATIAIIVFASISMALFALWESNYGGEGAFSNNKGVNNFLAFFLGLLNVRVQVMACAIIYDLLINNRDPASLRVCEADPIDSGNSFVTLGLMQLLNTCVESIFETILQSYLMISDFLSHGSLPEVSVAVSVSVGICSFGAGVVALFAHQSTMTTQGLAFIAIVMHVIARAASTCLIIYALGSVAIVPVGVSLAATLAYNIRYHNDWCREEVEFGPGGQEEKAFHLFIDTLLTIFCPFANAGLDSGNKLYDEGSVRNEFDSNIEGVPISFTKQNNALELNFATTRALIFGLFRSIEIVLVALIAMFVIGGGGAAKKRTEGVFFWFVLLPLAIYWLLHAHLTSIRNNMHSTGKLDKFKNTIKKDKDEEEGCVCCGKHLCCHFRSTPGPKPDRVEFDHREEDWN